MIKHVFVLAQNSGGSTILNKILVRSKNATDLKDKAGVMREGGDLIRSALPHPFDYPNMPNDVFSEAADILRDEKNFNWEKIKNEWNKSWDKKCPIRVEKTTRSIFYADMLEDNFEQPHFICMMRNPYAVIEGFTRKGKSSIERITKHYIRCARQQIENINSLRNIISITYEDLCDGKAIENIKKFIPELSDINNNDAKNQNWKKRNLGKSHLEKAKKILLENKDVMDYFGYSI